MSDTQRAGRHRQGAPERFRASPRRRRTVTAALIAAGIATVMVAISVAYLTWRPVNSGHATPQHNGLSATSGSYIGLYARGVPVSYAPVRAFTTATGVQPDVVVYYSGWPEPFQAAFATTVANEGAIPLVQMNPTSVSIAAIAAGKYDSYLTGYAKAVRNYHNPVILSFGHEMNGHWYSWAYRHTSPAVFGAAWRHIVTLFRSMGARNVTWLWTVNTIQKQGEVPSPGPWWPGSSYVNWVGVDGYYTSPSSVFASLFGPTIIYLRTLTHDPILITETSATPASIQPTKIADLFAGVHLYGLLGFVWFDNTVDKEDWRLSTPAAIAAFRRAARAYHGLAS